MSLSMAAFGLIAALGITAGGQYVARRTRLGPAPLLAGMGFGLALVGLPPDRLVPAQHIYGWLLPLLVFEAALQTDRAALRRDAALLAVLAGPGVVLTALLVAAGLAGLAGWPGRAALLFGALIAATDPVAIIAGFRKAGGGARLAMLAEAESLWNDASAAILFVVILAGASGRQGGIWLPLAGAVLRALPLSAAIGALAGLLGASIPARLPRLVLLFGGTVAAYAAFWLAERSGGSGVLAALVCGLVLGLRAPPRSAIALRRGLEPAAMLVNGVVFLLLGGLVAVGHAMVLRPQGWIALVPVLLARAVTVPLLCQAFGPKFRPDGAEQAILVWGGMRGALALALALAVPLSLKGADRIPGATLDIVVFAVLVQGPSLGMWLASRRRAGAGRSG